jgi:glycosyltransferase involved in cell wall biosynthesis
VKFSEARVLFLTSAVTGGGGERHFMRLAPMLVRGAKARLLVTLRRTEETVEAKDVPVIGLGWNGTRSYPETIRKLARIIRQEEVDLVYSFSRCANFVAHYGIALSGRRPAWVAGVNSQPVRAFHLYPTLSGRFWIAMKRRAYPRADLILCNSRSASHEMVTSLACDPNRVKVVKNPMPIEAILEASAQRSAIHEQTVTPYFLCVSRLCRGKGMEDLLEAFRSVSRRLPHSLVVVGDGPLARRLAEFVSDNRMKQKVHFAGWQENPFPFYPRADAFVTASYWEGLPNSVLEAFALGTPVIATRCTSWIDEWAAAGACLATNVGDVTDIASAMTQLGENAASRRSLGHKAAGIVEGFSLETVVAQRDTFLAEALEGCPLRSKASSR